MARPRACLLALVAGAALAPALRAADAWPVPRGPSREPLPYAFDPKHVQALPKEFLDDAGACLLYAGTTHLVDADGTVETIVHEVTRLNGRKGIEKVGEYRNLTFTPAYQKLTLHVARVHKAGGKAADVHPRHAHLRDVGTDFLSYDPDKQLIISFPSLEVGDVVEVKWSVRGKNPEHAGQFFTRYPFGDVSFPVARDELRVRLPKGKALKHACVAGKLTPAVIDKDGARLYVWKATDIPRLPQDDNAPSKEELRAAVVCSTFASWEEVGRWKHKLREDCWKCTDEVRKVVQEVTKGLPTPLAKARALTYWVRRNVRYVSAGEKHDYTPHAPDKVLANRFGDCKDTSQLLAVMLREAGVAVELATLGTLDDGQVHKDVPSPWGTHAILLATIGGKGYWVDTTTKLPAWDFLPRDDRDRLCYLTDDKGKVRLVSTPGLTPELNAYDQRTTVWVGADGTARCRRVVRATGLAAVRERDKFVEVPPGERRRQVATELQDANARTRLLRLEIDRAALDDYDRPTVATIDFETPGQFRGKTDKEGSFTDSRVWGKLLSYTVDHDRAVPLVLPAPFQSAHAYVFHLPPAFRLDELPADKTLRSAWGAFSVKAKKLDGGELTRHFEVTFHTRVDKARVEPADFDAFRKWHDDINREYRVWLTLKPAKGLAAAPDLEALLAFDPQDAFSAAALARVYRQAGKHAEARAVLRRALHYSPDDVALWELAVECAADAKEEEKAQRELARRFPDDPRHALALGRFLVSQGRQPEARAVLEPLTRKGDDADRARAHFQLARSHYRKDELKPALAQLEQAAKLDADAVNTVQAQLLHGRILEELKRPADAARAYGRALAVDGRAEEALLSLIRLALAEGDKDRAVLHLRRYAQQVGDDVSGLVLAADTYLTLGRLDDALELALRAREIRFHEKAQRVLGLVYLQRGDDARALNHLEKAEVDGTVLTGLIRAALNLGRLDDMERWVDKAGRVDKPSAALREAVARAKGVLARREQLDKVVPAAADKLRDWAPALDALACAEEARAGGAPAAKVEKLLAPSFAPGLSVGPAHALRGRLALDRGKLARALADADQAVRLSPRDAHGHYVRGRVRLERGTSGALDDLQKAAELSGRRDADVLHALAEALHRAGRAKEALAAQKEAVKLKPGDKEMAEQLKELEAAARAKAG